LFVLIWQHLCPNYGARILDGASERGDTFMQSMVQSPNVPIPVEYRVSLVDIHDEMYSQVGLFVRYRGTMFWRLRGKIVNF
jgi:hypothetical protein